MTLAANNTTRHHVVKKGDMLARRGRFLHFGQKFRGIYVPRSETCVIMPLIS